MFVAFMPRFPQRRMSRWRPARPERHSEREVSNRESSADEMTRSRLILAGIAILGLFSAAAVLATNFQIYEVSAGNYAETMWPGNGAHHHLE